jgi:hypothetical protein
MFVVPPPPKQEQNEVRPGTPHGGARHTTRNTAIHGRVSGQLTYRAFYWISSPQTTTATRHLASRAALKITINTIHTISTCNMELSEYCKIRLCHLGLRIVIVTSTTKHWPLFQTLHITQLVVSVYCGDCIRNMWQRQYNAKQGWPCAD